jgi:hypothetical protein
MAKKVQKNEGMKIVRATNAGVFYGNVDEIVHEVSGVHVRMSNVRRIWYWSGAATLSQVAEEGVKNAGACKFSMSVAKQIVMNVAEIIEMSPAAVANLNAVPNWKA